MSDGGVNEDGFFTVHDRVTTIEATNFRYSLKQTKKGLHDPDCKRIWEKIDVSPSLFANSAVKKILQPTRSETIIRTKIKTPREASKKQQLDDKQVAEDSQAEEISTRSWETLRFWEIKTRKVISERTGSVCKRSKSAKNQFPISAESRNLHTELEYTYEVQTIQKTFSPFERYCLRYQWDLVDWFSLCRQTS